MEKRPIQDRLRDAEPDGDPKRRDSRDSLLVLARLRLEGAQVADETVRVRNVSSGGLMAQAGSEFHVGARVTVELEGIGVVGGSVAWTEAGRIGISFDHPIEKDRARKSRVVSGDKGDEQRFRPVISSHKRPPIRGY